MKKISKREKIKKALEEEESINEEEEIKKTEAIESETETETETEIDIMGEYQEIIEQLKNKFGGKFENIPEQTQTDLNLRSAHKELQEMAEKKSYKKAGQILQELREKIQETGDNKDGQNVEAKAAEAAKEQKPEAEEQTSELVKDMERENAKASQSYKNEIYNRFFDKEKFGLTDDIIESSQGILQEQMKDLIVSEAKNWLKEQFEDNPDNYPALEKQKIDKLGASRIMDLVENQKEFWARVNEENQEWKDIMNLRKSIEYFGEKTPPDIKTALMKRIPSGLVRGKLWEKITGESLDETAKDQAGIGEKDDFAETKVNNFKIQEQNKFFQKEWDKLSPPQQELNGNVSAYAESRIVFLKDTLNKNLKNEKQVGRSDVLALLEIADSPNEIEGIKATRKFFPWTKRKVKIGGKTISLSRFEAVIQHEMEAIDRGIYIVRTSAEQEWESILENQRMKIVEDEAKKPTENAIENCYQKMARDTAARFLERQVNKDPKRKAKIEKEFGKNKREEIIEYISDAIETGESISEGSGYDENADAIEESLKTFYIDPEKLTPEQKEKFVEYSGQKYGLIDWIFDVIFGEIKKK